jgi:hypothetical protein
MKSHRRLFFLPRSVESGGVIGRQDKQTGSLFLSFPSNLVGLFQGKSN